MPKKRFAVQDNYLLYYADSGQAMPTSVYARRNTVFNYSPIEFEIKEFFDNASVKVTIAELNAGNVVDLLSPTGFIQDSNIVALNFI